MLKKAIKYFLHKLQNKKIGFGTTIIDSEYSKSNWLGSNVSLTKSSLGKYTYISDDSRIRNCKIGAFCSIGRNVKIGLGFHPINYISTSPYLYRRSFLGMRGFSNNDMFLNEDYRDTVVGNDVWIGDNVLICGGCTINDGVIIGAGSIVTRDLEPYGIYAGVPAKLIRKRECSYFNVDGFPQKWWELDDYELSYLLNKYNE
ncbi:CatB-related O-acetyltransferase [Escherichia albertii]|uniref:Predicted acetyltransferase n=1 Tax=Escherichia albertii TaxID=208962 RepID=A0A5A4U407_ESCAL|nr:CatB-related O-acetyltransferase [Escherichia albertii]MCZ8687461.1 CatB-related O-acetyltransferase [Escherichia albertii]MCZ8733614.1 CatB-related O-acetyltransferase [Escherichia albertii]MCZ8858271.1 CatB-related O-acetyltransferase [Escherichia albertii]MCZ8885701.1 CatB-related O-acetyltransferase [Escherichia albertii]MCZ8894607.1 CatB-related O-acetyltransferase [Escherichia albertii]